MAAKSKPRATQTGRTRSDGSHDGFMRYRRFLWAKISAGFSLIAMLSYAWVDVQPRHNGGSWYGYILGTIGALLIIWLTTLGVRKRAMTRGNWSLKAWTSAHVYLGLSLIVIATLHTGFQLGWNVHTLAYGLMLLVIISGIFGVTTYAIIPRAMSENREEMTESQMLAGLRSLDRQLHDAAQPLDQRHAAMVQKSLEQDAFGGGILTRLSGRYPRCATRQAQAAIRSETALSPKLREEPLEKVDALLFRKSSLLMRMRKHLRYKALLEIWLFVHVPLTFALIAALTAHIISVFFYW